MKKSKPQALAKNKANLGMIIAFMIFLFAFCYVMYTGVGNKDETLLDETIEIEGGNDLVSKRLEEIIPFSEVSNPSYLTAYQNKKVDNSEVANDIFLQMVTNNTQSKSYSIYKDLLERLYGNNLFIIFRDFNVTGKEQCVYDNKAMFYQCNSLLYNGPVYTGAREIIKLKFNNDNYYLEENVLFYSFENLDNSTNYKVYSDYTYQTVVGEFTSVELNNRPVEEYLKQNFSSWNQKYQSKFGINNNSYRWINTERIN